VVLEKRYELDVVEAVMSKLKKT